MQRRQTVRLHLPTGNAMLDLRLRRVETERAIAVRVILDQVANQVIVLGRLWADRATANGDGHRDHLRVGPLQAIFHREDLYVLMVRRDLAVQDEADRRPLALHRACNGRKTVSAPWDRLRRMVRPKVSVNEAIAQHRVHR